MSGPDDVRSRSTRYVTKTARAEWNVKDLVARPPSRVLLFKVLLLLSSYVVVSLFKLKKLTQPIPTVQYIWVRSWHVAC